jgi:hypothetical protein
MAFHKHYSFYCNFLDKLNVLRTGFSQFLSKTSTVFWFNPTVKYNLILTIDEVISFIFIDETCHINQTGMVTALAALPLKGAPQRWVVTRHHPNNIKLF